MNLALIFLAAGPALEPPQSALPAPADEPAVVTTYDAFVATEEMPRLEYLKQPAIHDRDLRERVFAPTAPLIVA